MKAAVLAGPRLELGVRLLIVGLLERYRREDFGAAKARQWQRFARYLNGGVVGQSGAFTYGIATDTDEAGYLDYLCGVGVTDFGSVPRNFGRLCLSQAPYAVFSYRGQVASLRETWPLNRKQWSASLGLSASGWQIADTPCFERYGESFNPVTGHGSMELWVPIVADAGAADATLTSTESEFVTIQSAGRILRSR